MTDIFAFFVRLDSVDDVTTEGYINEVRLLKQLQGLPQCIGFWPANQIKSKSNPNPSGF